MKDIKLTVYEDDMVTVKKECEANMVKIPFGIVRKLMRLFNVENLDSVSQLLNVVMESWDTVIGLLDRIFPDIEKDEWDYVDISEMVRAIYALLKFAFAEMVKIPTESKN